MSNRDHIITTRFGYLTRWQGEACLSVDLNSGYEEHKPHLSVIVGKFYLSLKMPKWTIHPHRRKVLAQSWDAATVTRMGRDWYWDETRRQFGLSVSLSDLRVHYGVQPDCSPGDKHWMWSFPWMKLRYMGQRWYGLDGKLCAALSQAEELGARANGKWAHEVKEGIEAGVPKAVFEVEDFDGKRILATTHIEEREWHRGEGYFKWLAWFFPARVSRSLDIAFDHEVGYEKGSWKGGLMGCGIDLLPGELHEAAMRRFCSAGVRNKSGISELTLIGPA